jgi:hypothetical protein
MDNIYKLYLYNLFLTRFTYFFNLGNVTCTDTSKMSDFSNFKSTMESIIKSNYSNLYGRIAYRLVKCEPICKEALIKLSG